MDPAGPSYESNGYQVRVDPTDAKFVDIIHTNGDVTALTGSAGMISQTGHVDFYPNGGQVVINDG